MSFTTKKPNINDLTELNQYLEDLESRIYEAFHIGEFDAINLNPLSAALDKPRKGDIIYADGDNFDPNSGEGVYRHDGESYTKLG